MTLTRIFAGLAALGAAGALMLFEAHAAPPTEKNLTKADIDRLMTELSNWNRWGKDDQVGTVNLITPATRKRAAALVREGVSVSLARDIEKVKAIDNPDPFQQVMKWDGTNTPSGFSLDVYTVLYHGYGHTHMDALCHMFYNGKMYNGYSQTTVTQQGAQKNSILAFKNGFFARGILLDIPRLKGLPYLEPTTAIYPSDLEAWEKQAGVKIGSGDIVVLRTGRWARRAAKGPWDVGSQSAGLHASCMKWLKARDVAVVGSDAATDLMPSGIPGVIQPIHQLLLIAMGTPIFDNLDLEAVSKAAGDRKRWEFLLTAAPLAVPGGTGSPFNPIATF
jgi:kynurenine formamidase